MTERASTDDEVADRPVFAAEIRPHRSLGPKGFAVVMAAFGGLSAIVSVPFFLMGAWPIVGFLGLDVLALWFAFRFSFEQARACEQVALTYVELLVRKISPKGVAREWRFNPLWVRIETERDEDFGMTRLALASRGSTLDVGGALSPEERADFAEAFGRALASAKAGPRLTAPNG
ncbi:MAG: DUF2244 domain-containing protein [Ancylobacter novellus]|uniref:DUF2244 domain-containing protein n=1 Tax=Ancylobacter novellus TaxID=921 RepID=A0A2W5KVZ6_ANCNO|nr:MAG: DUF2244 domain-containing protein [Ancylobacter novellus]